MSDGGRIKPEAKAYTRPGRFGPAKGDPEQFRALLRKGLRFEPARKAAGLSRFIADKMKNSDQEIKELAEHNRQWGTSEIQDNA